MAKGDDPSGMNPEPARPFPGPANCRRRIGDDLIQCRNFGEAILGCEGHDPVLGKRLCIAETGLRRPPPPTAAVEKKHGGRSGVRRMPVRTHDVHLQVPVVDAPVSLYRILGAAGGERKQKDKQADQYSHRYLRSGLFHGTPAACQLNQEISPARNHNPGVGWSATFVPLSRHVLICGLSCGDTTRGRKNEHNKCFRAGAPDERTVCIDRRTGGDNSQLYRAQLLGRGARSRGPPGTCGIQPSAMPSTRG